MKNILLALALLSPLAAHADDISINCDRGKIVFGSDDVAMGKDSTPSLSVDKKDVDGIKVIFRESGKNFVYVVTEPQAKEYKQYTFTVSRGCEGEGDDKGKVTVHTVGDDRQSDKSYSCTCDVD